MANRNLIVRAGFDANGLRPGIRQANNYLSQFGQHANRTMSGLSGVIGGTMGRIGKLIAVAFAVGEIAKFSKECIELGSDLSEVQNVVDVTFGSMAEEVNKFASTSIEKFGLSETAAKQYTGTMGAMLKSCGLTTKKALEMSKTITGLSADMASFYNLKSDEAFAKIRAGISGETEPLKQLGINMSVANLEAYAMSEGITKAYKNMSQQEQTLLRYNYLLSVTKDAQGDFARTSDSWANQTRILAEQFNALKASIGQGLIVAFTPIVQGLNIVIGKLRVAAGYFKAFMELIFGKQSSSGGGGVAQTSSDVSAIEDAAGGASDAIGGVGDSADKAGKKAAKAAKGALANFDELNTLAKDSGSGSGGAGGGSGLEDMGGAVDVDLGSVEEGATKLDGLFSCLIDELTKLKDLFAEGFKIGLGGDFQNKLNDIKNSISCIKDSLIDIATDPKVVNTFNNMIESWALNAGKITGSFASIGATIAQNLLGGINKYLDQNKEYIKDRLSSIMNVTAEISDIIGNFAVAFADIFSIFGSDTAQQITADIMSIFNNAFLGVVDLALRLGRDILKSIVDPISNNKGAIKTAIEGILSGVQTITGTLSSLVTDTFNKIFDVYDQYIKPAFDRIAFGATELLSSVLDFVNTYVVPTFQSMAQDVSDFYNVRLKPIIDKLLTNIGKIAELISVLFTNVLVPIASFLLDILGPIIKGIIDIVWDALKRVCDIVSDAIEDVLDIIGGVLDFLTGIFTGDWERAWQGLSDIVDGFCKLIWDLVFGVIDNIIGFLQDTFVTSVNAVCETLKKLFTQAWEGIKIIWSSVSSWFDTNVVKPVANFFTELWEGIKQTASSCWQGIQNVWNTVSSWFTNSVITPVKNAFTNWKTTISNLGSQAWNGVKTAWSTCTSWFSSIATGISTKFSSTWNNIKNAGVNAFNSIKNGCKSAINGIIDHINSFTSKLGGVSFDVPAFFGGGRVDFRIPKIPKLARGGIVDGATFMGNYIAGEAGKEMIVPLENTSFVDKLASSLGNAVMYAMSTALNTSSGIGVNGAQSVQLEMDGMTLARTITPYIIREMKRLEII